MDLETLSTLAHVLRSRASATGDGATPGLRELRDRYVGRAFLDVGAALLGTVEDILVTPREKIPRHLVVRRPWRPWRLRPEVFVYPLRALAPEAPGAPLHATHTAASIARLLDFRPEFLRTSDDPDCLSLVEYLAEHEAAARH